MVYVDTSALVPIFVREPKSEALVQWLESESPRLAISGWSMVEFASACTMKVRGGHISSDFALEAWGALLDFTEDRCLVAHPGRGEFEKAAQMARNPAFNVRAGDALHLAIAEAVADSLMTFDSAMAQAAKRIHLTTVCI